MSEHRMMYVKKGTCYGVLCWCGGEVWLETKDAKIEEGADLETIIALKLHASAAAHVKNRDGAI